MQKRIPAVYMRGGTSKGIFFLENHLPQDQAIRDQIILAAYGSPDPNRRQIDGMGGATSVSSKVAIICRSLDPQYDVVYLFGQVAIDRPLVDYKSNCGNISSAVGPFAVDQGLVKVEAPMTRVRIFQANTQKLIVAEVPVKEGIFDEEGDYGIDGVPGTGSKITLRFDDPGGAVTGKLFPTGSVKDTMDIPGVGPIDLTVIDAANPVVIVRATDLGLQGTEIEVFDQSDPLKTKLEAIRTHLAVVLGFTTSPEEASQSSQAVPKIACVAAPSTYTTIGGKTVDAAQIDLVGRIMSMGSLHRAYAVSGAVATVGAAMTPGSVVHELLRPDSHQKEMMCIGHPSGTIDVGAQISTRNGAYHYEEAVLARTARRLMEGHVLVPQKWFPS